MAAAAPLRGSPQSGSAAGLPLRGSAGAAGPGRWGLRARAEHACGEREIENPSDYSLSQFSIVRATLQYCTNY